MEVTINIPITVHYYCKEDKIPAEAMSKLMEHELLKPEMNAKLAEVVEEAKVNALKVINELH